jgi:Ca2+-binding RTX toxin-like protein
MPVDYYVSVLNGIEIPNVPGGWLTGTAGNDDITLHMGSIEYFLLAQVRVNAGDGDDRIYGDGVTVYGGRGNDVFLSTGTFEYLMPFYGANRLFGQSGNDACFDHVGSTDFYGGTGSDLFSTHQPGIGINHSWAGDVDRAFLERGNDTAEIWVEAAYDTSGAIVYEDRSIHVDGGSGIDHLILRGVVIEVARVDFWRGTSGTLALNTFTATGFETFDVRAAVTTSAVLTGGMRGDFFQVFGAAPYFSDPNVPAVALDVVVRGGTGNDTLIGSHDRTVDRLNGQDGDDVLVLQGMSPWIGDPDIAYGGAGNDVLSVDGITISDRRGTLYGGSGADSFIFSLHEGDRVIADFTRGQDRILLDRGSWWRRPDAYDLAAIAGAAPALGNVTVLSDTASQLQFMFTTLEPRNLPRDQFVLYDRDTGTISHDGRTSANTWDNYREWAVLGRVTGAPDLTLADFGILG